MGPKLEASAGMMQNVETQHFSGQPAERFCKWLRRGKAFEMAKSLRAACVFSIFLAIPPLFVGCDGSGNGDQANQSPQSPGGPQGPPRGGPGSGPEAGPPSGIKPIMTKLAKGPNSLTPLLERELKQEPPPWETIQGQAKEYALLASELGAHNPPKGSKESWATSTAAYAGSATDLDKAAQAKDKDAALAAHGKLANSCMACHREHRRMGPGMGGPPGGPPPGGPRPGGMPPDYPAPK